MLRITIHGCEQWDDDEQVFIVTKEKTIELEHSLVSISKWESKWNKPFLSKKEKTIEEMIDYYRCMTITPNVDPNIYYAMTIKNKKDIENYIEAPMTATWFSKQKKGPTSSEQVTSELIYYWMINYQIPFECQKWHLNRLMTLIKICQIKSEPGKKMSERDVLSQNAALNAYRRKKFNTKG